ncbi:MAG: hypothetical protein JST66_04990 [Bacteroidetes bacterium]|nr:hypothetical protein [Bacteroidota bacterium]
MKRSILLLAGCGLLAGMTHAQWEVPTSVVLDGADPAQRQVTGLSAPTGEANGANLDADRYRTTSFGVAEGDGALTLHLTPSLQAYVPGLRLTISPQTVNQGDVTLDVDGLGPVPVRKYLTLPLDSGDLVPGIPVDLIYDGAVFQVNNQLYPACPPGMTAIGREACIELTTNEAANWYAAGTRCVNRGLRLCSFSEWMTGCLNDPSFITTVSDYEWVDDAANLYNSAKTMGISNITSLIDCRGGGHRDPLGQAPYRCCSSR